jgi:chromatin remodeling complex protein RSC6
MPPTKTKKMKLPKAPKGPKTSKATKSSKKAPVVETPPVVEAPTPVVEAPTPVVETPTPLAVETPPVVETPPAVESDLTDEPSAADEFDSLLNDLKAIKLSVISMHSRVQKLQKRVARDSRKGKKKTRSGTGNKNNGFSKPVEISKDLRVFLGLEVGTKIARTNVTKGITKYIKEHELQDNADKRIIHVDSKLSKLLNSGEKKLSKDVPLTYFNLQTYLKHHYPKVVTTV